MSKILFIVIFLLWFTAANSQNFKEVKSADDVIENYVTAIGGAENLSKINSIDMRCTMSNMDSASMRLYLSKSVFYINMKYRVLDIKMCFDFTKKTGWIETLGKVTDMNSEDSKKSEEAYGAMMWGYYLNPSLSGISYRFDNSDKKPDTTCYEIDILKNDSLLLTAYIDKISFMKTGEMRGNSMSSYGDFRKITEFGIMMPFAIGGEQVEKTGLIVTKYVINKKINSKFLKRPVEKTEGTDPKWEH